MSRSHLSNAAEASSPALEGRVLSGIVLVTCTYCIFGSIVTLLGWILDYPPLTDWIGQGISMFVNTAVCAIMGAVALMLLALGGGHRWAVLASRVLAILMAAVGGATLFQHFTGVDLGIDRLLLERTWGQRASASPMRMGPPACTAFLFLGMALVLASGGPRCRRCATLLAVLTVGITSLSLVGYMFGTGRLFGIAKLTGIAWQTSTILAALGVGVIAAVPEHGLAALLRRRDAGGVVARRLLLPIVAVPLFFGWLEVQGQHLKYYDAAFGTAILVLATITMLVLMLCWAAEGLSRQELLTQAARDAERQTEARLASILEQLPLGVGVSDLHGNWVLSNPMIRQYVPQTVPSRDPAMRERWSSLTPEGADLPPDQWPSERALRGESVSPGLEMSFQNEAGNTIWLRSAAVPLRDERGEVAGAIAVIEDIDKIKRAEMALRVSEERFTRFMQSLPGLAWIKDLRGRYVFASDAAIKAFNCPREELYGHRDDEVFPPEIAAQFMENDTRALSTPEGLQTIEKLIHEGGEVHYSIVSKFPIPGQAGSPMLVGGIAIDITDRMRAEEALREADRRKDEFLATLAHELRNPLAPIRFGIHMFHENPPADTDQRWAVEVIDRQVQQMARLLEDLLDVSRISYNKLELRKERVELGQIIQNTVETSRPLIEAGGHQLTVSLPPEPLHIQADPARLSQIFSNLLNNAAKYTENGGQILIAGVRQENLVELVVRDNGIGIAPDMLPRVFEMFAQVKRGSERSQGGLGIGLSLVRGLVELHGGSVDVRSEGLNQGSEFIVRLPLAEESWPPSQLDGNRGAGSTARCRVLVADDLRDSADSLAILLRSMGHEVYTAYDGEEALAAAENLHPQVLLLDLGMPKLTGHEVCRKLRERPWAQNALIIAMTGWGRESDRRRTQEAGFDHHLIKPVAVSSVAQLLAASSTARARGVELEPV